MPEIGREPLLRVIREKIEVHDSPGFNVDDLRVEAKTAFGEYGQAEFFTGAAFESTLRDIVQDATAEGLTKEELQVVFKEVRRHVSAQSHFGASREHEAKRAATSKWKVHEHLALNMKDAATRFGRGVANDVRSKEQQFFSGHTELQAMIKGAVELAILRHRLERFAQLDDEPTPGHQPHLRELMKEYRGGLVNSSELLDTNTSRGKQFDQVLDHLWKPLDLRVGGHFQAKDKAGNIVIDVDIENEHVLAAIKHHLKFFMYPKIIKMLDAQELTVLSSDEYDVTHKTTLQKALELGKGIVTSGTFLGATTRVATRIGFGAAAVAGGIAGGPALWFGLGIAVGAGAAAGYVRESMNAKDRIKRRRLEAAFGAIDDTVIKKASVINKELVDGVTLLRNAKAAELTAADPDKDTANKAVLAAVEKIHQVIADAQARLLKARIGEVGEEGDQEH
ncbi:MAG: hypothetical protein HY565_00520, partial [Candidatus Kerfeldbacteria bacterium]|nr:hypothetical protein [Candidatus Kerfeldbacteria bacterium]